MTSRYNIYFNANESFKAGVARIEAAYIDDYSELLDIFEYSDPSSLSPGSSNMERAVQKASKVISLKSITAKPEIKGNSMPGDKEEEFMNRKEYNEWVDDSYLIMGKARLYKRDYDLAKSTLSYNISSTVDKDIFNESTIWLARVYNETGNYNESYRILNELDPEQNLSASQKALYYTTLADLYLKQKRYDEAVAPLSLSLQYLSGKRTRYRLTFLLAQLYEKAGEVKQAEMLYQDIIKMNPPYEVEFNARINIAGVFDVSSGNTESIRKELEKMLKDSKNKEFRDQIYYALGNLYKREGNAKLAIENYTKSAAVNAGNQNQKAKSYLALGEFYFTIPDYVNSGKYYDSAMMFVDQRYPDYQSLKNRSQSLDKLVEQLTVIEREDSLQKVARMNPEERKILIAGIIEKVVSDEKSQRGATQGTGAYNLGEYYENERRFQNNINQEGKWYFYNQTALTFGRTEFRRRWGERKLEDNWRRFNKSRVSNGQSTGGQEETAASEADSTPKIDDNKTQEFYLRDLPVNDSLAAVSNDRIASALLESGKIYSENFRDDPRALRSYDNLLQRFPGNRHEPETYYNIYKLHRDANNQLAEAFRQRLVEKYPDNEFTKIISDPDYYAKKLKETSEVESQYQKAYEAYQAEDFTSAIAICDKSLIIHRTNELAPKFLLLRSFCIARLTDERKFKEELSGLIKLWPDTPEAAKASEIIAFLNKEVPQLQQEEDLEIAREIYVDDMDSPHTFVLIIRNPVFNINQASFDVISYNIDNYTNNNYRTQGTLVDDKYIMLTVSGFKNTREAMEYHNSFRIESIVRNPGNSPVYSFIIGKRNLETLATDKNPERYLLFFTGKYLGEGDKK